jgi:DNA invertase Pin-like site-specific DNA recombinase
MPELNTLTFGIFAVMAQYERELISARTSRTLQEIRKTKKLGNPLGWSANLETALETKKRIRNEWLLSDDIKKAMSLITLLLANGKKMTLHEICRKLNYHSIPTQRGKKWNPIQVKRLLKQNDLNL